MRDSTVATNRFMSFAQSTDWDTFRSDWNLEMFVFEERKKMEYPEKNLLEPTTNSTHIIMTGNRTLATLMGGDSKKTQTLEKSV